MDLKNSHSLKACLLVVIWSCAPTPESRSNDTAKADAAFICESLRQCFGLKIPSCRTTIIDTTSPDDIADCANCYKYATCDEIGEPGTPGVCDTACSAALFGG